VRRDLRIDDGIGPYAIYGSGSGLGHSILPDGLLRGPGCRTVCDILVLAQLLAADDAHAGRGVCNGNHLFDHCSIFCLGNVFDFHAR